MQKTLQALISQTERALYQSSGPGVQVYAQDDIAQHLNDAFKHCYRAEWWPQYRKREVRVLDGVTGQVTADFTDILAWDDIQHVYRDGSIKGLSVLPASLTALGITGDQARFIEADGTAKLFTVFPRTATGQIEVVGRKTYNSEFGLVDVVPFDDLALVHFAAWSYFVDDASNPASAMKHQGLYESRMRLLRDDSFGHTVELNPHAEEIPTRWS